MIPEALQRRPRWILHKDKVPVQADGRPASTSDPATWTTYEKAVHASMKTGAGLGFVLGDGIVGVDLDHCCTPQSALVSKWAAQIIREVKGYVENSPSGTGLHLLAEGPLPKGFKKGPIEVYGTGAVRYLTMTGQSIFNESLVDAGQRLAAIYPALRDAANFLDALPDNSDVRAYWLNERTPEDDSTGDWAAINALAKFLNDGDPDRIERAMRLSGLVRPRWDERRGEVSKIRYDILRALEKLGLEKPVFQARELKEIIESPLPDPVMLVEGLMEATTINMIAGPSYAGKSTIGLDIALSVSAGLSVFGRFKVNGPVNVAYVYGEQGELRWEKRLRDIATFRGLNPDARPSHLWLMKARGMKFNQTPVMRGFCEWCKERKIGLVFFDPLSTLFPSTDENAASDVIRLARGPLETLVDAGITVGVMHHSSKGMGRNEDARAADLVRGSGDFQAMTSSIIGVQYVMSKQAVIVKVQGRDETAAPFALTAGGRPINTPVSSDAQTRWAPVGFAGWLTEVQDVSPEMQLLTMLGPEPQSIADLALKLGREEKTVKNYLTRLRRQGSADTDGKGNWAAVAAPGPAPDVEDTSSEL